MISRNSSADFLEKRLSFSSFSSSSLSYRSTPGLACQGRLLVDFLFTVFKFGSEEIAVAGVGRFELGSVEGDELTVQTFLFGDFNEQAPVGTDPR
jgi:hypothetical protein